MASPETGYYGIPLLKAAAVEWEIPPYFFVGGAAGSAAVIGAVARWTGRDRKLARDCRYIAAGWNRRLQRAADFRPWDARRVFSRMMRVFKPQSPMSVGAWTLAVFGTFLRRRSLRRLLERTLSILAGPSGGKYCRGIFRRGGSAVLQLHRRADRRDRHSRVERKCRQPADSLWHVGLNSAVSILELMGHDNPALNTLGIGASAIETLEGVHIETSTKPAMEPLKRGSSGLITRLGGVLSGPVPLVLRVAAAFAGPRYSRRLRKAAAVSSIAGSMLTRIAWVHAGHVSARNWRLPLDIKP